VTLPLHIVARVREPIQRITAAVLWQDGTELARTFTTVAGPGGGVLLIGSLDWNTESRPPQPVARQATLLLRDAAGGVLARRPIQVMRWDDPGVQEISLFWTVGSQTVEAKRRIPATQQVAAAALRELLWGPTPGNLAGFDTALPDPGEVLAYTRRGGGWGARVTLRGVTIQNGVALADFSVEMNAYGGEAARGRLIAQQVDLTLRQFRTIVGVRIAVDGQIAGPLQP
jgi:hypothetical protein